MDVEKDLERAKALSYDLYDARLTLNDADEDYKDEAGAHGYNAGAVGLQAHLIAAAVDADDATQRLRGPVGPVLRAGARALPGTHAHARVVGSGVAAGHHCSSSKGEAGAVWVLPGPLALTKEAHMASKPGSVLDVHAMSSTVMPGVTRPRIAPKVAMR